MSMLPSTVASLCTLRTCRGIWRSLLWSNNSGLITQRSGNVLRVGVANPSLGQDRLLIGAVTIEGEIMEFSLQNPITVLKVNAPNAEGRMQIWPVEWESGDYLKGLGFNQNTLTVRDNVIVTGYLTRGNALRLIAVQRPSDGFSWGYLNSIRFERSDAAMFVTSASQ